MTSLRKYVSVVKLSITSQKSITFLAYATFTVGLSVPFSNPPKKDVKM